MSIYSDDALLPEAIHNFMKMTTASDYRNLIDKMLPANAIDKAMIDAKSYFYGEILAMKLWTLKSDNIKNIIIDQCII
jgi:hypothetical protein